MSFFFFKNQTDQEMKSRDSSGRIRGGGIREEGLKGLFIVKPNMRNK
jgi:hypothetical protein